MFGQKYIRNLLCMALITRSKFLNVYLFLLRLWLKSVSFLR